MKRALLVFITTVAATTMVVGAGTVSAGATEHNQQSCEEAGGVWASDQGSKSCTFSETDTGKNDNFQCTTTEETSGQGNLGNRTDGPSTEETEQNTGSGKCPPGQY